MPPQQQRKPYDGAVALGCVIRGETIHFEIVSEQSARGADGSVDRAQDSDRQRHPHRRQRGAGLGARARRPKATRAATPRARRWRWSRIKRAAREGDSGDGASDRPADKDDRKANRRGAARLAAVQALYQMDIAGTDLNDILAEFESHWLGGEVEGDKYLPAEAAFFRDIVARRGRAISASSIR